MYIPLYSEVKKQRDMDRRREIIDSFSIERINGTDCILHRGVVVSRASDTDILERLEELRQIALNGN